MENKINRILEKIGLLNIVLEPVIDIQRIIELENKMNVKFPDSYVAYLTKLQNGGSMGKLNKNGPYYGIYSLEESITENNKWEVDIIKKFELMEDVEKDENNELDYLDGTIPICEFGCGVFFRLIINGNKSGEIIAITIDDKEIGDGSYLSGYYFMNVDILTFYENWLDRKIENNDKLINAYYSFLEFGKNIKYKLY